MGFKTEQAFSRDPSDPYPAIVAHRGASSTHPENTLPAFAAALDLGAQFVELDVRLSADGFPVVIHDPEADRTTDGSGLVHELTLSELKRLNASGDPDAPAEVPTLEEVIELVAGRAGVILEIKNIPGQPGYVPEAEPHVEAAFRVLEAMGFEGPVVVCSFNPASVSRARALADSGPVDAASGLLTIASVPPADALEIVRRGGHGFVLPQREGLLEAGEPFVERAHEAGVRVGTWTVDHPPTIAILLGWGVDAIATNDPATGLRVRTEVLGGR